jgi:hypothetical protein
MMQRTIYMEVVVHCCRVDDGSIAYTSEPNRMTYGEKSDSFEESLVIWRDRMLEFVEADLEETVDKELCQKVGGKSLKYCGQHTTTEKIKVEETEVEVVEKVEVVEEVEKIITEAEKAAARGRIKRIEQQLFGTPLEAVGRMEIERIKKIYRM